MQINEQEQAYKEQNATEEILKYIASTKYKLNNNDFAGARVDVQSALIINPSFKEAKDLEILIDVKEKDVQQQNKQQEMKKYKAEAKTYSYTQIINNNQLLVGKKKIKGILKQVGNTHSETMALLNLIDSNGKATNNVVQIEYSMDYYSFKENDQVTVWGEMNGIFPYNDGSELLLTIVYMEKLEGAR